MEQQCERLGLNVCILDHHLAGGVKSIPENILEECFGENGNFEIAGVAAVRHGYEILNVVRIKRCGIAGRLQRQANCAGDGYGSAIGVIFPVEDSVMDIRDTEFNFISHFYTSIS